MNTSIEKCLGDCVKSRKMTESMLGQSPDLKNLYINSTGYETLSLKDGEIFRLALLYSYDLMKELCVPPWREGYWEMIESIAYCVAIGETLSMEELYIALKKNKKMREWTFRRYLGNISGFCFACKLTEMEKLIGVDINAKTRLKNKEFINASVFFIRSLIAAGIGL